MRRALIIGLALLCVLVAAAPAGAAPGDPFQFKSNFDTAAVPGGLTEAGWVAVNRATGNVLVQDRGQGTIVQFDSAGEPVNFPATGTPSLTGPGDYLYVDNSGGLTQGNIYVFAPNGSFGGEQFFAWNANGEPLAANPAPMPAFSDAGAVAPDGKLWAIATGFNGEPPQKVIELKPNGEPTGVEHEVTGLNIPGGYASYGPAFFDEAGDLYFAGGEDFVKLDGQNNFATLGDTGLPSVLNNPYREQPVNDPSTEDVLLRVNKNIIGIHRTDPLVKETPFPVLDLLSGGGGFDFDPTGQTIYVAEQTKVTVYHREPPSAPYALLPVEVDAVRSASANLHSGLISGGVPTTYHFEYGPTTAYGFSTAPVTLPFSRFPVKFNDRLEGLVPGTTYHLRLVAENSAGVTAGPDRTFHTFVVPGAEGGDPCPNALARKQTSAQRLPNCRAYEMVSANDTAGYDVESYLAPGQEPFPGFPLAKDRVLYATHSGAIPGPWNATNRGPDPYLAVRGSEGWTTTYWGLPANINGLTPSFSSVLGEADAQLDKLAFAGPGLCSPCFTGGGLETGIPVRLADGRLVQGMAGSLDPGTATAKPEGKVAKTFSGDGRYLVFASKYAFEPGANTGGDLTVYERDLAAGSTRIVSTDGAGATLTGAGISELDVSGDGSRVLVGKLVSTDGAGNEYVHPYLHLGSGAASVDLAPLASDGVRYAGMTADGSKVFFTTVDALLAGDSDTAADLYEADVDGAGNVALRLLSGTDAAACNPVSNSERTHWNSVGGAASCDAVPIGGGGGVAAASGDAYFLSPSALNGEGTLDQPNLYLTRAGSAPHLVATLEPDNPLVLDSVKAAAERRAGDFQTTPTGGFAVFVSALELSGDNTFDDLAVFRFAAATNGLVCASCDPSNTDDASLAEDATLAPDGLSVLEDGRVFFTTRLELTLNDANRRRDVYQWSDAGGQQLISAGSGPFDSALLSTSADGTDVFFFTHEALASEEDTNGSLMKIYDAREYGGFFKLPASVPCQASDECHGPGTEAPGPPVIQSSGKSTPGNFVSCTKKQVKRHGKCVKKHAKPAKKKKHRGKHGNSRNGDSKNSTTKGKMNA